jgi:small redox-active disulfide protein 2
VIIQVLGTGCGKCKRLYAIARQAAEESGVEVEVQKVEDIQQIMAFQIFLTPGLAIDGQVKAAGRIPSVEEVKSMIQAAKAA